MRRLCWILLVILVLITPVNDLYSVTSLNKRLSDSLEVLRELTRISDSAIPSDLLRNCHAIAIFPSVYRGGFIIGGSFGRGVVFVRDETRGTWRGPVFLTLGGGSLGWQIGLEAVDLVLVIMNRRGIDALTKQNLVLGGDVSIAAGPVGRKLRAGTDIRINAEIYSYSRSKGLFAGISLDGSYVQRDINADEYFYGKPYTLYEILYGDVPLPPAAQEMIDYLNRCCGR